MIAFGARLCATTLVAGVLSAMAAIPSAHAEGSGSATLDAVRARGELLCGVAGTVPGFSLPDSQGVMRGLDADSCRAVAAAAFGKPDKVKFVPTTTQNRFTALQSGEVDLLSRSTTWTLAREANLGLEFAWVNYYDGTGFLVKKSSGVKAAKELDGATICVQPGTSTELAIADYFRLQQHEVHADPDPGPDGDAAAPSCPAAATPIRPTPPRWRPSASARATKAEDFVLLPDIISKEPLGVMVRKGDDKWFDIVRWTFSR